MTLYEEDFYAWTRDQAERLREIGRGGRPNAPVDWDLLAEEVESLGRSDRDAVRAQVVRIISHMLKLEWSPARHPRFGWRRGINDAHRVLDDKLTPTLRHDLAMEMRRLWGYARRDAVLSLVDHDEAETAKTLPAELPYALDQILREDFLPANIHGIVDEVI